MKISARFWFETEVPMSSKALEEKTILDTTISNLNDGLGVYLDPFLVKTFEAELQKNVGNAKQQLISAAKKHSVTLEGVPGKPDTTMNIDFKEGKYVYKASGKKDFLE